MAPPKKEPRVSQNPFKGNKAPKTVAPTDRMKAPRVAQIVTGDENNLKVRFCFDLVDHESEWSLLDISREDHEDLLAFLKNIETMTAGELFGGKNRLCKHYADFSSCPNADAPKRLAEKYEALDSLTRLELTGLKRLYGVRAGNEFHIVWWDPGHNVWPSTLKHT